MAGNVRELKNLIERAVIMEGKGVIEPELFLLELLNVKRPGEKTGSEPEAMVGEYSLDDVEKIMIKKALAKSRGNVSKAARLLKIYRDKLRYRLKKCKPGGTSEYIVTDSDPLNQGNLNRAD